MSRQVDKCLLKRNARAGFETHKTAATITETDMKPGENDWDGYAIAAKMVRSATESQRKRPGRPGQLHECALTRRENTQKH